jgi:hypothetical protein
VYISWWVACLIAFAMPAGIVAVLLAIDKWTKGD